MKVLMTTDAVGGVLTHVTDLVAALGAQRVEVAVVALGPPPSSAQRRALAAAGASAVHVCALRLEWMDDPWDDVDRSRERLLELAADERADLVHLNGYAVADAAWDVPVVVGAHSCVLSWWRAVHGVCAPPAWEPYRRAVAAGLRRADAVVAPTRALLGELQRLYGPLPGAAAVVPNGSRVPAARLDDLRKEPFALAAGRLWDAAKNLAVLDAAADGLGHEVLVAGATADEHGRAVDARAARLLGELHPHDLAALRRRAAVFAAPARYEPFGLAALEAARDGCALVLGDIPSLREVWDDAATFVDPADPDALRAALHALLADPAAARAAARRAQRHAARYTPAAVAAGHLDLYRRLAPIGAPA